MFSVLADRAEEHARDRAERIAEVLQGAASRGEPVEGLKETLAHQTKTEYEMFGELGAITNAQKRELVIESFRSRVAKSTEGSVVITREQAAKLLSETLKRLEP